MTFAAFWAALCALGYTYFVMPVVILLRGVVSPRPLRLGSSRLPSVSLIIAAHNEEESIGQKVANVLASDYPPDLLELIVASDGSSDATVALARSAGGDRVMVLDGARTGKAGALNAAAEAASGLILAFSDANSFLAPTTLQSLVGPFADPHIGGVAGDQRYVDAPGEASVATGERGYWNLDRLIKVAESRSGSVVSATGSLYAIRREHFLPVPEGVTDDFTTSTAVLLQHKRLVFCPEAQVFEPVAASAGVEYGRKVRVMTRGLRAVALRRELLDPRRHGFYAVQLLWHKVLRRLMAVPLIVVAFAGPALWRRGRMYQAATIGQVVFYGAAGLGLASADSKRPIAKLVSLPAYFFLVNAASLHAMWNLLTGRRIDRWVPQRASATPPRGRSGAG